MIEFRKYIQMRESGEDALAANSQAKKDGLDTLKRIRMLRAVYNLSLKKAQGVIFKEDTGKDIENHPSDDKEEYINILDEELGLGED